MKELMFTNPDDSPLVIVNGRTDESVRDAQRRIAAEAPKSQIKSVAADLSAADGASKII